MVRGRGGGCAAKANAERAAKAAPARMERVRIAIGDRFEIVEETKPKWFVLKCRACGHEFKRHVDLNDPTTCPECRRIDSAKREEYRRKQSTMRALVRALRKVVKIKQDEARAASYLDEIHVCKECGKSFTMRELRASNPWNYSSNPKFCCLDCGKRFSRRNSRHRRRELGDKGSGVSVSKIIERDGSLCWICGLPVDEGDCTIDDDGNFIAGRSYPSVDHVVPLSLGGKNDMNNARLAHCYCNVIKGSGSVDSARETLRQKGVLLSPPGA